MTAISEMSNSDLADLFDSAAERMEQRPELWRRGVTHQFSLFARSAKYKDFVGLSEAPACWLGQLENCLMDFLDSRELATLRDRIHPTLNTGIAIFNDQASGAAEVAAKSREMASQLRAQSRSIPPKAEASSSERDAVGAAEG